MRLPEIVVKVVCQGPNHEASAVDCSPITFLPGEIESRCGMHTKKMLSMKFLNRLTNKKMLANSLRMLTKVSGKSSRQADIDE